ncbi:hypothetical protein [Lactococcus lactis]|uniref:hypothetical protein n=1 Tax=Lactococcus lactis TaxID=1358 RepID=UPI0015D4BDC3|nr:hypothetical protein [Lactococcus lactis]GFO80110.1 hypothetical protein LL1119B1_21660 [Lactococcus lactis]
MKNFIYTIIETDKVVITFLDGSSKTFEKPIKDEMTDSDSIILSSRDKDYFINLNSIAHVTKHITPTATVKSFSKL